MLGIEVLIMEDWELEALCLGVSKSSMNINMVVCETLLRGLSPVTIWLC